MTVLVIEAGDSDAKQIYSRLPAGWVSVASYARSDSDILRQLMLTLIDKAIQVSYSTASRGI